MVTVSADEAKARLSELLDMVESGQEVTITRGGEAVANLSAAARPEEPLLFKELAEFRATIPQPDRPWTEMLREMRDEGY